MHAAREALAECRLCTFECGVDRRSGPAGICRADAVSRVFHEGIEWAGESALVPTYVVSLSGCNMACSFCLTGESSQDARAGSALDADALAARIGERVGEIRSVTLLGGEPSIHLDGALEIAARVPRGLKFVWKTNAISSPQALDLLEGVPDVVLADYKFGNDRCAETLARIPKYTETVRRNLRWAARTSTLIVRHLLMPGHVECCFAPVADWMAEELPQVPLSLMTGFLPVFRASDDPTLGRTNRADERRRAAGIVRERKIRLMPWKIDPRPPVRSSSPDEIWIDRDGTVLADSASGALAAALARLQLEFALDSGRIGP